MYLHPVKNEKAVEAWSAKPAVFAAGFQSIL
jgi:hypothetical protein